MNTEQLFSKIDRHFLAKLDYIQRFTSSERQIEGWFKGELIYLFTSLQGKGELEGWEPEVLVPGLGKKRVDFRVKLDNGFVWLEFKSLYHGQQRGQPIDLGIYFYKDSVGIWDDVQKLASVVEGHSYCVMFIYPRPEADRWQELLTKYRQLIGNYTFQEQSNVSQFPSDLYIAKIEIAQGSS